MSMNMLERFAVHSANEEWFWGHKQAEVEAVHKAMH